MSVWTAAPAVREFLARATRRADLVRMLQGAAAGMVLAAPVALALASWREALPAGLLLGALGAFGWRIIASRAAPPVALLVERRTTVCRNTLVTADELLRAPEQVPAFVGERVCRDAAQSAQRVDLTAVFPTRRPALTLMAGALVWLSAMLIAPTQSLATAGGAGARAAIDGVTIEVTPPAYAGQAATTARDPSGVTAFAGSRVAITVRGTADAVILETLSRTDSLVRQADGTFSGAVLADADGYIALESQYRGGSTDRRMIALSVTPDRAPRVVISAPARDFFLPRADRNFDVAIQADDDLALNTLLLKFTKVSGSGEQFSFTEGELPIQVQRTDARTWRGRGAIRLTEMKLEAGDMLVYRAVATDARPGAAPSESDSYIIEIASPGSAASEGYAVDDERDRYAISQQMVIVKTERLIAQRATMSADDFRSEAARIAAEQRQVRSEFVFMMGGELAEEVLAAADLTVLDETAEAEAEDDILAGRLQNQGRIDILRAIRSMSRAATALTDVNVTKALTDEKAALAYLQRAFSRTRYILRTLTQRERLDLARRLSGALAGASRSSRAVERASVDGNMSDLRRALRDVVELGSESELDARRVQRVWENVVRADPSSASLRAIGLTLSATQQDLSRGRVGSARVRLDSAAVALGAVIKLGIRAAPQAQGSAALRRLDGLRIDALRAPQRVQRGGVPR